MYWISINDRLPKAQEYVVFLRQGIQLAFGYKERSAPKSQLWTDVTERDRDGGRLYVFDATHWYPIPKDRKELNVEEIIKSLYDVQAEIEYQFAGLPIFDQQNEAERKENNALVQALALLDDTIHALKEVSCT